jgi:ferredoxin
VPTLRIDNQAVTVPVGATLLDAAAAAGIAIPTLCHVAGCEPSTSCMVCLVQAGGKLTPACATAAQDGMEVLSQTPPVLAARRMAVELLLWEHVGDCVAPCQALCPAGMDIPRMLRQIAAGDMGGALKTVHRDIALPAILGRICPAPCEAGCRRRSADGPVAICRLKQHVADVGLAAGRSTFQAAVTSGRRVAIIGGGPCGLAAAQRLRRLGHGCDIYERDGQLGGALRGIAPQRLPTDVLDAEIAGIVASGVGLRLGVAVGRDVSLAELTGQYDAVLLACGHLRAADAAAMGLAEIATPSGLHADRHTCATPVAKVFAAGGAMRPSKMAIRAVAEANHATDSIHQLLTTGQVHAVGRPYTCHIGKLDAMELASVMAAASPAARAEDAALAVMDEHQARQQAARCLHCECRKADNCRLRDAAEALGVSSGIPHRAHRRPLVIDAAHPALVYEAGKCILCGLCIQVARRRGEGLGLAFSGRGPSTAVKPPLGAVLAQALSVETARACAAICPTGAMALK